MKILEKSVGARKIPLLALSTNTIPSIRRVDRVSFGKNDREFYGKQASYFVKNSRISYETRIEEKVHIFAKHAEL